jgi:NAD(P)-dependent dehydrogenase (short-subunit alcohol dehydrogenase family)
MEERAMNASINGKTVLVTGANRGIGEALVTEALRNGAARVYAGARSPYTHPDPRVTVLPLDITDEEQVRAAAAQVGPLDVLVNNAGVFDFDDLSDRGAIERHLTVNLFGTYTVIQAFLPGLVEAGGVIVNNTSVAALAPIPVTPAYSISKAALLSLTQSLRMLLAGRGVRVHAVLTGPVDTDMTRVMEIPKASPQSVAQSIFAAVDRGEEDIFPDPLSGTLADGWYAGPTKALEVQNAAMLQPAAA